LRLKLALRVIH